MLRSYILLPGGSCLPTEQGAARPLAAACVEFLGENGREAPEIEPT